MKATFKIILQLAAAMAVTLGSAASVEKVTAGPLTIEVHLGARTAHLFHVVDQMSGWSEFCHRQYAAWWAKTHGPFTAEDLSLLSQHAEIRKRQGWGGGLERALYVSTDLDEAFVASVQKGYLTKAEADAEKKVLLHFAPKIEALMSAEVASGEKFLANLKAKQGELASFATKASRLFGVKSLSLPVYAMVNPDDHSFGGGYSNGIITIEVPRNTDVFPTLLHETFHAFIDPHRPELQAAAKGVDGLDEQTLNEGLAYALSPGLLHAGDPQSDPLRQQVASDIQAQKLLKDSYTRFNRYGLALRGIVRDALEDDSQTLKTLLPRAVDAWQVVNELSLTYAQRQYLFSIGAAWEELNNRSWQLGWHLVAYTNVEDQYELILKRAPKGSTLFILYAADADPRFRDIPEKFRDLLPVPMAEIDRAMKNGESIEKSGTARDLKVVLLAAPTTERLTELVKKTALLKKPS